MDFILHYYFDFNVITDHFDQVINGFWVTLKLSVISGALALTWGLILAVLRQLPGRALAPIRWLTIGYIDVFRGIPLLLVLLLVSGSLSSFAAPIGGEVIQSARVYDTARMIAFILLLIVIALLLVTGSRRLEVWASRWREEVVI